MRNFHTIMRARCACPHACVRRGIVRTRTWQIIWCRNCLGTCKRNVSEREKEIESERAMAERVQSVWYFAFVPIAVATPRFVRCTQTRTRKRASIHFNVQSRVLTARSRRMYKSAKKVYFSKCREYIANSKEWKVCA